jgi:cardiolipin synthase C
LTRRGVRVRVLTNSLASAEKIPLAHSGYARRRGQILAAGLELYEMRPEAQKDPVGASLASSSGASLHTKAIVIDRRHVVVGSMNLDPRSRLSNTEVGVLADSTALGKAMGELFDDATQPARAFRVSPGAEGNRSRMQWATEEDGRPVVYGAEPLVSSWRRLLSWLLGAVAPESTL